MQAVKSMLVNSSSSINNKSSSSSILKSNKKKVKRLSSNSSLNTSATSTSTGASYYATPYISNPCDQLFGPTAPALVTLSTPQLQQQYQQQTPTTTTTSLDIYDNGTDSYLGTTPSVLLPIDSNAMMMTPAAALQPTPPSSQQQQDTEMCTSAVTDNYIPAPRWTKTQNSMLEELFRKNRFPKQAELKSYAQRLHVMDSDVEEWFRRRRGRDRKTRRKNEALKNLIDNFLDK